MLPPVPWSLALPLRLHGICSKNQIADQVEFRFADGAAPTVVQDASDPSALYVLMPMRV